MKWDLAALDNLRAFRLAERDWDLQVIPDLGGKICSLRWRGRELLAGNPRKPLRLATYAADYSAYDASGFDECFPTIGACPYPLFPWAGSEMPDHGELWSLPWDCAVQGEALHLQVHGVRLPYRFAKTISFDPNGAIRFHYRLDNLTQFPLHYLWSAHPLFTPQAGAKILLPAGTLVLVDWSRDGRLGEIGSEHAWPYTQDRAGNAVDLSLIQDESAGTVEKLYTARLAEGWCALWNPPDGLFAAFTFSSAVVPYVGLSINLGGWPVDESGYYNLGLEPCSGYPDRLDLAVAQGTSSTLPGRSSLEWDIYLSAGVNLDEVNLHARLSELSRSHRHAG